MYEELIKSLRLCREILHEDDSCIEFVDGSCEAFPICAYQLMEKAADAIEKLQKPRWIKFTTRELDEEEREEYPDWNYILDCQLPDDDQEILVSNGRLVWMDTFFNDEDGCYIDSNKDVAGLWWMPSPEPPKEE